MAKLSFLLAAASVCALPATAAEVMQLSFDAFNPVGGSCELNEMGFMSNPAALRLKGTIRQESRGPLCEVSTQRTDFNKLFQVCSLAFVEAQPSTDYVCGIAYLPTSVEFSYGYKHGSVAPPMCSFVCVRK